MIHWVRTTWSKKKNASSYSKSSGKYIHTYGQTDTHTYVNTYIQTYISRYIHIFTYVCVCMYMYLHILYTWKYSYYHNPGTVSTDVALSLSSAQPWRRRVRTWSSSEAFPLLVGSEGWTAWKKRRSRTPRRSWARTAPGWPWASTQTRHTSACSNSCSGRQRRSCLKGLRLRMDRPWSAECRLCSKRISFYVPFYVRFGCFPTVMSVSSSSMKYPVAVNIPLLFI